jgi:short-subunit dehydrogenase
MSYEAFEWIMGINFWGVVHGTKAFLPHLKSRQAAHVVNISSIFGIISVPKQSAYNATKFAVRGFTEALRQELAETAVRVTSVHPGGIKTNIARAARLEGCATGPELMAEFEKNFGTTAGECAAEIIKAMAKGKKRLVTGAGARPADLVQRLFPACYELFTRKLIKGVD